ncbi:phage tail tape measure protein [Laribacter hongkongensis]|uniref:phage tail tape measure protein n=1 Tax=Laribacter hongkongensis TaxID=168471 RepID=UPI0004050291|nr:phage tail tape measure protein [Laribacter hongkongensis]
MALSKNLRLEVILAATDKLTGPLKKAMAGSKGLAAAVRASQTGLKELQGQQQRLTAFRDLSRETKDTALKLKAARQTLAGLQQQMASAGTVTSSMTRKLATAQAAVSKLSSAHKMQLATLRHNRTELEAQGLSVSKLASHEQRLGRQIDTTSQALARQSEQLKRVSDRQKALHAAKGRYDKTLAVRDKVAGAGVATGAAGGGMLLAGQRLVQPGVEFDTQMSKVQALARLDKNGDAMHKLRQQARELGASTSFSANQVGQGQGFLAMAGFTPDAIRAAMPGMLDVAKAAGMEELGEVSDISSNILTGFNLKAGEMTRVGDVLTATFTRSNTDLRMLGETMKYVGPVAAAMGTQIEVASAMAGKLGDAGIQGSMAGTAMRAILGRLAAPPKAAALAMKELGIKSKDAKGNLRPVVDILSELHQKTSKLGNTARADYFKAIAGEEAFAGLEVLVKNAGSGELQALIGQLQQANGTAAKVAKTMGDNLTGDISNLKSAWEDVGIEIFDSGNSGLRAVTQGMTDMIRKTGNWIKANPELVSTLIKVLAVVAVIVTTIGGLSMALAAVIGPMALVKLSMSTLGIKLASGIGILGRLGSAIRFCGGLLKGFFTLLRANPFFALATFLAGFVTHFITHWGRLRQMWTQGDWRGIGIFILQGLEAGLNAMTMGLYGTLKRIISGVISLVMNILGINSPSRVFAQIGEFLMAGLVNGITSGLANVKNAIIHAGEATIGWFKQKLGIHSPSRVFAALGGFTMAGLAQGLEQGQAGPLGAVQSLAGKLTAIGAGVLVGGGLAQADAIRIDNRPPVAMAAPAASGSGAIVQQVFNIYAAPGMDERTLAAMVRREVEAAARAQAARGRSSLKDRE